MADTTGIIECPACGKKMKKIYIPESGINIDICLDGCGGIYFDNREFEKFDESYENADAILSQIEGKTFAAVNGDEVRICPVCGIAMSKMGAAGGEVEIDVCHNCGSKFLDNGELQKIRKYENDDIQFDNFIEGIFDSIHKDLVKPAKASPRRKFFEDLVRKYI